MKFWRSNMVISHDLMVEIVQAWFRGNDFHEPRGVVKSVSRKATGEFIIKVVGEPKKAVIDYEKDENDGPQAKT